ncbi:MAG: PD-(D/E)XK nuclease family protein [Methanobrevibacter sp.]|nr:PD-(D/E)XK nuclease family protein [Candidatus Methanovirga aequatorialis]
MSIKVKLSTKSKEYNIPEYSLTGDLLSFLTCNLQYRYQNKGFLPPSRPLQLWFGEFVHGVMEEAYTVWTLKKTQFPWDWLKDIRPIEEKIDQRMQARGLYPPNPKYFTPYNCVGESDEDPSKRIISTRIENSINLWGKHLFPLMDSAEVLIKGLRKMPLKDVINRRSDFYCVNGVIDVISSLKINSSISKDNLIVDYLKEENFYKKNHINSEKEYEIIIDYKGMKRPQYDSNHLEHRSTWNYHQWQILTYSWLRCRQANSRPIISGIIFYLNELLPSNEDLLVIKRDVESNKTDVEISKEDRELIEDWDGTEKNFPELSDSFKLDRSIRIIEINDEKVKKALREFDNVVNDIEKSTLNEGIGTSIKNSWKADGDNRTCDACDFKNFCNKYRNEHSQFFTVP